LNVDLMDLTRLLVGVKSEGIIWIHLRSIDYDAILNDLAKFLTDEFLIIANSQHPGLVVNTLVNGDINLLSALLKIINEVIVELTSFDHISIPTLADLLIEYLLLPFVMVWLAGVDLYELSALLKGLLQVLQVFRVPNVLHDILLEVSHLGLQAREEVSDHPTDLLLHEVRVCRLHLIHTVAVLLILLGKAAFELLNY
jgi:hypothetical protein